MKTAAKIVLPAMENLSALPVYVNLTSAQFRDLEQDNSDRVYFDQKEAASQFEENNRKILDNFASHNRTSFNLKPGADISFGSFFNAFPVAHWKQSTNAKSAYLEIFIENEPQNSQVKIKISDQTANVKKEISGGLKKGENVFEIDFADVSAEGGFAWAEIFSGDTNLAVREMQWMLDDSVQKKPDFKASIAITTFNNPNECVKQIERVAANDTLRSQLEKLIIVDQGTRLVKDDSSFANAAQKMGDQLKLVEQGNLGGSGGFARGQLEAVCGGISGKENLADAVILMDDDVVVETEAISRAIFFASCCEKPQIIGAHMFALERPTDIANSGEIVEESEWTWRAIDYDSFRYIHMHLAIYNYVGERFFAQRREPTHNGWWMCLIPRAIIDEIGLSLPGFIKWDDVEYGLRANRAGFKTVTLPGVHVWHLSFLDKNDLYDWQAYYHVRNALVTNLVHSQFKNGGKFLPAIKRVDQSYLTAMHYGAVSLHADAIEDVLSGPDHLHKTLSTKNNEVRAKIKLSDDGKVFQSSENELLREKFAQISTFAPSHARSVLARRFQGLSAILLNKFNLTNKREVILTTTQSGWWDMYNCQTCYIFSTDGKVANIYHRSHSEYKAITKRINSRFKELNRNWAKLKKDYSDAFEELVSPAAWRKTFEVDGKNK